MRALKMVTEFHLKHGFPVGQSIGDCPKTDLVRAHLIAEELGELVLALAERDRVRAADALADLMYVVVGAAVTYAIPLDRVFEEVHRSNMTKAVRRPDDTRLRDKGSTYVPADVAGVLAVHDVFENARRTLAASDRVDLDPGTVDGRTVDPRD